MWADGYSIIDLRTPNGMMVHFSLPHESELNPWLYIGKYVIIEAEESEPGRNYLIRKIYE